MRPSRSTKAPDDGDLEPRAVQEEPVNALAHNGVALRDLAQHHPLDPFGGCGDASSLDGADALRSRDDPDRHVVVLHVPGDEREGPVEVPVAVRP